LGIKIDSLCRSNNTIRYQNNGYEFYATSIHDAKLLKVSVFYTKKFKRIKNISEEKPIAP
jgi:hypothetical protein